MVGTHKLTLLNFYPFLQRYAQPQQRDATRILACAAQACHDEARAAACRSDRIGSDRTRSDQVGSHQNG